MMTMVMMLLVMLSIQTVVSVVAFEQHPVDLSRSGFETKRVLGKSGQKWRESAQRDARVKIPDVKSLKAPETLKEILNSEGRVSRNGKKTHRTARDVEYYTSHETRGPLRLPLEAQLPARIPLEMQGPFRLPLGNQGRIRLPLDTQGPLRLPLDTQGLLRLPIGNQGLIRLPLKGQGPPRLSFEAQRSLRFPVETQGFLRPSFEMQEPLILPGLQGVSSLNRNSGFAALVRGVKPETAQPAGNRAKRFRDVDDDFRRMLRILEERRRAEQMRKLLDMINSVMQTKRGSPQIPA
ncbi:hypothetical protein EGW08_014150 [Elysia chlorotica]|uniref:Corticotropin-releasing factor domain-containing protein n=1 Tax=Elysia chlorotica TaxID=188477 RepID=A0A3S1B265_ELYCH|nr:hypothetical protein EGW08_014150 [Elysia chlorotica]